MKKKKSRTKWRLVIIAVLVIELVVIAAILGNRYLESYRARSVQKQAATLYYTGKTAETSEKEQETDYIREEYMTETASGAAASDRKAIVEDFMDLYQQNPDIVGWLKAGENIDYPVVWRENDNEYYLQRDFFQKADSNGTLFMNTINHLDPRDDVLLIHGHHMNAGDMFGKLDKYEEFDYLCRYPIVSFRTIYDQKEVYYTPIAAFNASMMPDQRDFFDATQINFEDAETTDTAGRSGSAFECYLDEITSRSLWDPKVDVTADDQLLMLVTCSYDQIDGRFMLICRQLREEETPAAVTELYSPAE